MSDESSDTVLRSRWTAIPDPYRNSDITKHDLQEQKEGKKEQASRTKQIKSER